MSAKKRKSGATEGARPYGRLSGRPLLAARAAWALVVATTLGLFALSLPTGYAVLRTVCSERPCAPEQLSPGGAKAVERLGLSLDLYAAYNVALVVALTLASCAIAAAIFWRRSDDPMALFTSLTLVLFGVLLPDWTEMLLPAYPSTLPALELLNSAMYSSLFILFYVFPDGRFVPRWTRWLAAAWVSVQLVRYAPVDSPLMPWNWSPILQALLWTGFISSCLFAQVYRYRRVSGAEQRQQTKWVVFGLTTMLVVLILATVPPELAPALDDPGTPYDLGVDLVSFLAVLLVPASFGVAILRHRLFDIDVIINRALVYGLLTASLAVVYVGGVVVLQILFRALTGGDSQLAVVVSTLAIAALFNPLRRGNQTLIDRRFYRKKYDAARTLEAFSARLRRETDLDRLGDDLVAAVRGTVQPAHASLWLRPAGSDKAGEGARR
jgi:hypothetical protein